MQAAGGVGATPHVVALLEVPHPLSGAVHPGFWSEPALCTVPADGKRGRGVAVVLRDDVVCLGAVVEEHWLAVAVRVAALGDMVVVAAYLPPLRRGAGPVGYREWWAGMLESGRRLQMRCSVADSRLVLLGDMNAHLGTLLGGSVPVEVAQVRA